MLITLTEWDEATYSRPHHINTLRKWAKCGRFNPPAEKHGREWLVSEDAKLIPIDNKVEHRLRQAKAMLSDEPVTDLDPRVLEILNNGSCAA